MRIATIDIGTNTVLLLVAETRGGELCAVEEHATITRLGQGVDRSGELAPDAVERTLACLDAYANACERLGVTRTACVGTSAMRDARGGEIVRARVRERFGVEARVVSGEEEARLTFVGSLTGLGVAADEAISVFDIGGGSTEIVRGTLVARGAADVTLAYARSFDVGSVRMTERHVASDPPAKEEIAAIDADVRSVLAVESALPTSDVPVGIAGTMTTLAAVSLGLETYDGARVHGHVMSVEELRDVVERLATMSVDVRRRVAGMEPKRADVIVAGGCIALAVLERLAAKSVMISDRGVRWGLAMALTSPVAARQHISRLY